MWHTFTYLSFLSFSPPLLRSRAVVLFFLHRGLFLPGLVSLTTRLFLSFLFIHSLFLSYLWWLVRPCTFYRYIAYLLVSLPLTLYVYCHHPINVKFISSESLNDFSNCMVWMLGGAGLAGLPLSYSTLHICMIPNLFLDGSSLGCTITKVYDVKTWHLHILIPKCCYRMILVLFCHRSHHSPCVLPMQIYFVKDVLHYPLILPICLCLHFGGLKGQEDVWSTCLNFSHHLRRLLVSSLVHDLALYYLRLSPDPSCRSWDVWFLWLVLHHTYDIWCCRPWCYIEWRFRRLILYSH
jgi:hypothetical protein